MLSDAQTAHDQKRTANAAAAEPTDDNDSARDVPAQLEARAKALRMLGRAGEQASAALTGAQRRAFLAALAETRAIVEATAA